MQDFDKSLNPLHACRQAGKGTLLLQRRSCIRVVSELSRSCYGAVMEFVSTLFIRIPFKLRSTCRIQNSYFKLLLIHSWNSQSLYNSFFVIFCNARFTLNRWQHFVFIPFFWMDGGGGATSNRLSGMLKVEQKCNVSRMYLECASNVSRTKLCEIVYLGVNWTPIF